MPWCWWHASFVRRLCDSFASQVRVSTYRLIFSNSIELLFFSIMRLYAAVHFTVTNDTELCHWHGWRATKTILSGRGHHTRQRQRSWQPYQTGPNWLDYKAVIIRKCCLVLFIIVYCMLLLLYLFIYFIFVLSLYECVVFSFSYSVLALLYVIFCTHAMVRL